MVSFLFGGSLSSKTVEDREILTGSIRLISLVDELRSTNNSICLNVATEIEASLNKLATYDLHLRSVTIFIENLGKIAQGIAPLHQDFDAVLGSLSPSYRSNISTELFRRILEALPDSVSKIGLAGCNLNDKHGAHVIDFTDRPEALRMVCMEDNESSFIYAEKLLQQLDVFHNACQLSDSFFISPSKVSFGDLL